MKKFTLFLSLFAAMFSFNVFAQTESVEYVISKETGTPGEYSSDTNNWVYNNQGEFQADLTLSANSTDGKSHIFILSENNGGLLSLADGTNNGTTFTVSVPENGDYVITGYYIEGLAYGNIILDGTDVAWDATGKLEASDLNVCSFSFTITSGKSNGGYLYSFDVTDFKVFIKKVATEGEGETGGNEGGEGEGGETTEINEVEVEEAAVVYDLTGRKVENPTKGLYIINGKTVLVK